MQIVEEQMIYEVEQQAHKDLKMGAKLNQIDEYQEWIINQEWQKNEKQLAGSNVFTYKNRGKPANQADLEQD